MEEIGVEEAIKKSSSGADMHNRDEKIGLTHDLDALLERYLRTLDEYQKITQDLSKQLSSVRHAMLVVNVTQLMICLSRVTCL
jgi:hypothetical protein